MKTTTPITPLTEDQRRLIEDHMHIPTQIAGAVCRGHARHFRDFEAAAVDGLIRAAQQWQPHRGDFPMYAKALCAFAIQDYKRAELRQRTGSRKVGKGVKVGSLDAVFAEAKNSRADLSLHDALARPDDTLAVDDHDEAEGILNQLPDGLCRRIIRMFAIDGMEGADAGRRLGIEDRQVAYNLIAWCLKRLRTSMRAA